MQRFYRQEGELLSELSAYGDDSFFNPEFTEVDRVLAARLVQEDLAAPLAACAGGGGQGGPRRSRLA